MLTLKSVWPWQYNNLFQLGKKKMERKNANDLCIRKCLPNYELSPDPEFIITSHMFLSFIKMSHTGWGGPNRNRKCRHIYFRRVSHQLLYKMSSNQRDLPKKFTTVNALDARTCVDPSSGHYSTLYSLYNATPPEQSRLQIYCPVLGTTK